MEETLGFRIPPTSDSSIICKPLFHPKAETPTITAANRSTCVHFEKKNQHLEAAIKEIVETSKAQLVRTAGRVK